MSRRTLIALLLLAAALALAYGAFRYFAAGGDRPTYKLAKVESGPIVAAVSATGTLNPVVSVQVGSQVSGQLKEVFVDFNAIVKQGQLIARIDPENFQHRVRQAEADLDAARAAVAVQRAEIARAGANLADAQRDYERKKMLVERKFISSAERDKAQTTLETARAQAQVSEAQTRNSEAMVRQREAQLAQAKVDLERTAIRAPVDGIVVKRSMEPGQTVAASLQAPELFIIAKNLTDMQVETSIDEADVGRIRVGQKASFTVDAFPGRSFEGSVMQVRKAAQVVSNVVTYTVVVSAANHDLSLLPGMTANVRIVTAQKDKVLKVANAALRFRPAGAGEDKASAGAPSPSSAPAGSQGAAAGGQLRERLVKELKLDADQQAKLDGFIATLREKGAALRDQPEAERGKALERNRLELRERLSAILRPEQKARYDEMLADSRSSRSGGGSGRVWVVDAGGQPKAVPIRTGLSDGGMTEIVSGELVEGAEVIVGTATATSNKSPSQPGPRMF
jgi:HlyD family secretion protein